MARSRTGSAIRAAAGVADLDPLTPATFSADEPDANGDGIPALFKGQNTRRYIELRPTLPTGTTPIP